MAFVVGGRRRGKCAVDPHGVLLPREKGCFTQSSAALVIYLMSQKLFMIPFVLFSTVCECFMEPTVFQNKSHWYTVPLDLALSHASARFLPVVNKSFRGNQGGGTNGTETGETSRLPTKGCGELCRRCGGACGSMFMTLQRHTCRPMIG